jgi:hypothetical protein
MSASALMLSVRNVQPCTVCFLFAGVLPVSSIALHCAGVLALNHCLLFLVIPAFILAFTTAAINTRIFTLAFRGWISGVVAVALYDLSRVPFILAGWEDFIPHITEWLTGSDDHAFLIGYAWRYIGNGGGLGIVFFLLADHFGWKKYIVSNGVSFGLLVFASLVTMLIFLPESQQLMFKITPLSFFGGMIGHIVYGYVLGRLHLRYNKKGVDSENQRL